MSTQHSQGRLHRNIPPITKYPTLFAGRNTHVAVVVTRGGISAEEAEANADRLVLCWNTHDTLVAAVRSAHAALTQAATFPADIDLARSRLAAAMAEVPQ